MISKIKYFENKLSCLQDILIRAKIHSRLKKTKIINKPDAQELDVYWEDNFKISLESWGEDNVWIEIELLLCTAKGKIVDICCGIGSTMKRLQKYSDIDLYGKTGGSLASTTYTVPMRNADGMFLDASDNELYVVVRYKGDPTPITSISLAFS